MKWLILPLSLLALVACSGKPPAPKADAATPAPRTATPWDDLKKQEQKAKDVQKVVDHQADEQRRQIDAAEQ